METACRQDKSSSLGQLSVRRHRCRALPAQKYLYGYDPALAAAGQQGSSVEMIGGGSDSFNQMTSAGADVFSQAGVTVEVPTTRLSPRRCAWQQHDDRRLRVQLLRVDRGGRIPDGHWRGTRGDAPHWTWPASSRTPIQLEILGGGLGSEHWSVEPAQTTTLQILGTDLIDGQTVAEPPIAASGIQVLALDTAVGALATGLGSGTERANPGNNTFMVGDLSETGIQQVILNAHESQGSPDLAPDTIIIDGSQIPDSADKVAIADENFQDGNSRFRRVRNLRAVDDDGVQGSRSRGSLTLWRLLDTRPLVLGWLRRHMRYRRIEGGHWIPENRRYLQDGITDNARCPVASQDLY